MKPRNIGPAGMSRRVTAIDAVWNNPNIIYLGTASGGEWKTENSGTIWKPIFDEQPIINIGLLSIQQSNPSVIWIGTSEGNPHNSLNIGEGIYKNFAETFLIHKTLYGRYSVPAGSLDDSLRECKTYKVCRRSGQCRKTL